MIPLAIFIALPTPLEANMAEAQPRQRQGGILIQGALGVGKHFPDEGLGPYSSIVPDFNVRLGLGFSEHLVVFIENTSLIFFRSQDNSSSEIEFNVNMYHHGVGAQYYLFAQGSTPYLKAGAGLAWYIHPIDTGSSLDADARFGLGASLGAGEEIRVGEFIGLTLEAQYLFSQLDGFGGHTMLGTVGLSFYTGPL